MAIRVTPEDLENMATRLERQAQQAERLARDIQSVISSGTGAWEGAAQRDFVQRFEELKPTLERELPQLISAMAQNARKRAEAYRAADRV